MKIDQTTYKLRDKDNELSILRAYYKLFDDTVKCILDCQDDSIEIDVIGRFDRRRFGDYSGTCLNEWLKFVRALRANGMEYRYFPYWGDVFCFAGDVDIFKPFKGYKIQGCCDLDIRCVTTIERISPLSGNKIFPSLIEIFNIGTNENRTS
jgi:hypothetical protein